MTLCHPHNLRRSVPSNKPFGIRVSLRPGDPFANLVGTGWEKTHWFPTERERDEALAEMSRRYPYFRVGDTPALVFERIDKGS